MEIAVAAQAFMPAAMPPTDPRALAKWIDDALKRRSPGDATRLAEKLKKSPDVVSKIRHGIRGVKASELAIIEHFFDDLAPTRLSGNMAGHGGIRVVGYVGAGGAEHRYDLQERDLDLVSPPLGATDKTVAVEIRGDSLGPALDHWLAFYDDVRAPITDDLIGHLCVVGLEDGRVLIKKLVRGKLPGTFDLVPACGETIRNAKVAWGARVKSLSPGH
jgi:hypothetical protein